MGLLVFAVVLGVYFFFLTHEQPVWWDEAEYLLKGRAIALGTPETGFFTGRPMLLPLAISALFSVGLGEEAARVLLVLTSIASMVLTFRIGRRLFGALAGFTAAVLLGSFYVVPFYASRVMTEVPHLALCLLSVDLMLSRRPRAMLASLPTLGLGVLTRFTAALMLPVLAGWAAVVERGRARILLLSAALAGVVVMPYAIWATLEYGDPLHAWKASQYLMAHPDMASRLAGLGRYAQWLWESLGWFLGSLMLAGLLLSARWMSRPRAMWRERDASTAAGFLIWIWLLVPLLYFGPFVREWQDRFLVLALPPAFLAIGLALARAAALLSRGREAIAVVAVLIGTCVGAAVLLSDADRIVRAKVKSFEVLRTAGRWIEQNTPPDAVIITANMAQTTYYSKRATRDFPKDLESLQVLIDGGEADYLVLSRHAPPPPWLEKLKARPVMSDPPDKPAVMVVQLRR